MRLHEIVMFSFVLAVGLTSPIWSNEIGIEIYAGKHEKCLSLRGSLWGEAPSFYKNVRQKEVNKYHEGDLFALETQKRAVEKYLAQQELQFDHKKFQELKFAKDQGHLLPIQQPVYEELKEVYFNINLMRCTLNNLEARFKEVLPS